MDIMHTHIHTLPLSSDNDWPGHNGIVSVLTHPIVSSVNRLPPLLHPQSITSLSSPRWGVQHNSIVTALSKW